MPQSPTPPDGDMLVECQARARRLARHLVRDPDDADDVVQEAALRALQSKREPRHGVGAYVGGIVSLRVRYRLTVGIDSLRAVR